MQYSNIKQQPLLFIGLVLGAFFIVAQTAAIAQTQPRIYKPGDMLEDGGGYVYKIIRCNGAGEWDECEYQAYFEGKPTGASGQKMTVRNLRAMEERVNDAKKRETRPSGGTTETKTDSVDTKPRSAPETSVPRTTKNERKPGGTTVSGLNDKWKVGDKLDVYYRSVWYPAEIVAVQNGKYKVRYEGYPASDDGWVDESRMRPVGGYRITAECDYDLPGDVSASVPASAQLFKKKIWQRYFSLSQAGGSPSVNAPLETGVAFLTFEMGASFKNTVRNLPGQGASRINNGAPVNATVYPVKTKFVICKKYKDGVSRFLHDEDMNCFKNKEGEWTCDGAGVPKITPID